MATAEALRQVESLTRRSTCGSDETIGDPDDVDALAVGLARTMAVYAREEEDAA